jgi:amino acid transporter
VFQELGAGVLRFTNLVEGQATTLSRILFGRPLRMAQESHERIGKTRALPILASSNISSSAYATEEILRILIIAGAGALTLTMPLSFALVGVIVVVVISYSQVIRAYPTGGGSYQAAKENLGTTPGLVAAGSLLVDYVLTVAVSVAAGVAALTSAMPALFEHRVLIALVVIAVLVVGNIRGVRESAAYFSVPTYAYLFGMFGLIAYGLFRWVTGGLPEYTPPPDWVPAAASPLTAFLLLRAFSSGAVALTGVEAVSNGMRILKPPEAKNAAITLFLMAGFFSSIFLGLGFLAAHVGLVPDPAEKQTLISQLARLLVGNGWYYQLVQAATALFLLLAANTAFVGFPRLSSLLADDRFMPKQFAFRGRRLALVTGIVGLAVVAGILILIFQGSVNSLIPLYTVGVFVAFTLSQLGMVRHWLRGKAPGWQTAAILNSLGAAVTGIVAIEVIVTKFTHGAWIVLLLIPILAIMMRAVNRHYRLLGQQLHLGRIAQPQEAIRPQTVLVPIADLNKASLRALAYAQSLSSDVRAIHVTDDLDSLSSLRQRWEVWERDIPLVIIEEPYRDWATPLLRYVESLSEKSEDAPVTVVVPEFVPKHWWEHFLHSQSALHLKAALLGKPNVVVVDIPYHLKA